MTRRRWIAPGTQELTFEGRQPGESQLVFTYARSFEKTAPPGKVAKLPLPVKEPKAPSLGYEAVAPRC